MAENTAKEAMLRWCRGFRRCFTEYYLWGPSQINEINHERGWPCMFSSIYCMLWKWKLCPVALQWAFQDKDKNMNIILKAVCDQSLWVWHAFCSLPGDNNDFNVLDRSLLVCKLVEGNANSVGFWINRN